MNYLFGVGFIIFMNKLLGYVNADSVWVWGALIALSMLLTLMFIPLFVRRVNDFGFSGLKWLLFYAPLLVITNVLAFILLTGVVAENHTLITIFVSMVLCSLLVLVFLCIKKGNSTSNQHGAVDTMSKGLMGQGFFWIFFGSRSEIADQMKTEAVIKTH